MDTRSEYDVCLDRMFRLRRFGIKLGLEIIEGMLAALGHPERRYRCIHVAGTNGKGSVAATLAEVLRTAGHRVGLYTSPHLVRFNERICIDGRPVDDAEVVEAFRAVSAVAPGGRQPTFFEFATAMALDAFARRGVDWAVIETGMGGRLDATNVIVPRASVITNISLEHRAYLGPTIDAIAAEKAGIIKPGVPVVTGARQPAAIGRIRAVADARRAPLYRLGTDFRIRRAADGRFHYTGRHHRWSGLETSLVGPHQQTNAALALAVCEILAAEAPGMADAAVLREALGRTRWPGRLEIARQRPTVLLDGAHNLAAARNLARYLRDATVGRPVTLVVGILDDKPYRAMLRALVPPCRRVIVTRARIHRALPPERLADAARDLTPDLYIAPGVAEALAMAARAVETEGMICVAGSLYVVGEAKELLDSAPDLF